MPAGYMLIPYIDGSSYLSTSSYQLIDAELFKTNNFNVDSPKGC